MFPPIKKDYEIPVEPLFNGVLYLPPRTVPSSGSIVNSRAVDPVVHLLNTIDQDETIYYCKIAKLAISPLPKPKSTAEIVIQTSTKENQGLRLLHKLLSLTKQTQAAYSLIKEAHKEGPKT
ncbi:hypothetical protein Tco_0411018 [Tanacetum coccineum]